MRFCPDWSSAASGLQDDKGNVRPVTLPTERSFVSDLPARTNTQQQNHGLPRPWGQSNSLSPTHTQTHIASYSNQWSITLDLNFSNNRDHTTLLGVHCCRRQAQLQPSRTRWPLIDQMSDHKMYHLASVRRANRPSEIKTYRKPLIFLIFKLVTKKFQ